MLDSFCWMVTAALSAIVTSSKLIGEQRNSHGGTSWEKKTSLFPATLREVCKEKRHVRFFLLAGRGGSVSRRDRN